MGGVGGMTTFNCTRQKPGKLNLGLVSQVTTSTIRHVDLRPL